jgi:hypothetical protein
VPVTAPDVGVKARPPGREPLNREYVSTPNPPVAEALPVYAVPNVAVAGITPLKVIAGAGEMVIVTVVEAVSSFGDPESVMVNVAL